MTNKLSDWRHQINADLDRTLSTSSTSTKGGTTPYRLYQAMRYSMLSGGKRFRPLLVYATGLSLGADINTLRPLACAIELIHGYSLIHDDLPAMDDDAWRRGKPTCHIVFGEALAILAGNALQALAIETVTHIETLHTETRLEIIQQLVQSAGAEGIIGGQAIDILEAACHPSTEAETTLSLNTLQTMHTLKTAALIHASLHIGLLAAELDATQQNVLQPLLKTLGLTLGLLFQVQDDILDTTEGTAGHDPENKLTYPALLGLKQAAALCDTLTTSLKTSLSALSRLSYDTRLLERVIGSVIGRHYKGLSLSHNNLP